MPELKEYYISPLKDLMDKGTPLYIERIVDAYLKDNVDPLYSDDELDHHRQEKGMLSVIYIQRFWETVIDSRKRLRSCGSPVGLGELDYVGKSGLVVPRQSIHTPYALKNAMENMLRTVSGIWWTGNKDELLKENEYLRYAYLITVDHKSDNHAVDPRGLIQQGVGTALITMWGIIEVADQVFLQQYGRDIAEEEITDLVKNTTPLMLQIANSHVEIGVPLISHLRFNNSELFNPDNFIILGEDETGRYLDRHFDKNRRLYIRPEVLSKWRNPNGELLIDHEPSSGKTRCLAMFAKVENEKGRKMNVILDLWDWSREVAEYYYFSKLKTYIT